MSSHQEKWNKLQSKGFLRYVLEVGVLQWGIFVFIISGLINHTFQTGLFTRDAAISAGFCIIGGFLFGTIQWYGIKRQATK